MNALGGGDAKKGLSILNSFTDESEARKWIIGNVASGSLGYNKEKLDKLFDPNTNIGKTNISQLQASEKYSALGSEAATGAKIDQSSKENKNLKEDAANKDRPAINVNNNTTNVQKQSSPSSSAPSDDRPAYMQKTRG